MPRTDVDGRELQAVLCYELNRAVPATELQKALNTSRNTYTARHKDDDYPNAEEVRLVANYFNLRTVELLLRFGLVSLDDVEATQLEHAEEGKARPGGLAATAGGLTMVSPPVGTSRKIGRKTRKTTPVSEVTNIRDMKVRKDRPSL
ncbi:hypothetical protein JRC04_05565 [Mycolicibacterium sp. S2-37]|uniref:hypothetical protein n=1 Tax=Mycolicibacterium sp. S2-37 TaxID=2810297 RepID=UPI001A947B38|nr:hypothetical protein [Mycolicibacterium sp. S2-37]MBO0676924.1 hypothetical protein [Mycolicibacterium sp. S2-37]